jgi:hypothetical protein
MAECPMDINAICVLLAIKPSASRLIAFIIVAMSVLSKFIKFVIAASKPLPPREPD